MTIVVLHDIGDELGGAPWRAAFGAVTSRDVWAPDLPGHGDAEPPVGGNYTRLDPAYTVARGVAAGQIDLTDAVLVGVGASSWSTLVIAMARQGTGLVLVDGLATPWVDHSTWAQQRRNLLRQLAEDPEAQAAASAPLDPRLRHGVAACAHGDLVKQAAGHVAVPALLAGSPPDACEAVAPHFSAGAAAVPARQPAEVADATMAWLGSLGA